MKKISLLLALVLVSSISVPVLAAPNANANANALSNNGNGNGNKESASVVSAAPDNKQTIFLKGSGSNFSKNGWQNLFYLGWAAAKQTRTRAFGI